MFENTSIEDGDLELETSFTPIFSSTQENFRDKRKNELPNEENVKRFKINNKPIVSGTSYTKKPSFEKIMRDNSFSPKKIVKRMFPGPAGLLPDNIEKDSELIYHKSTDDIEDFIFCSQSAVSTFVEQPWKMMTEDFSSTSEKQLYETYTINWIKKKYCKKKVLDNYKAPFLAAIIQNLEIEDGKTPSVRVILKDTTGVIDAIILYSFYKEYSKYLTTGSVLVLQQISVMNIQDAQFLTLTSNNVLVIYHVSDNKKDGKECGNKEPIKKIELHEYSVEKIWQEANVITVTDSSVLLKSSSNPRDSNSYSKTNFYNVLEPPTTNFMLPKTKKIGENNPITSTGADTFEIRTKKKYDFKKVDVTRAIEVGNDENVVIKCSQMSVKANKNDSDIWKSVLEDVDTDSLFGDF